MLVYKYLERQYLNRFRNEGKLYINTVYNLRSCPHEPIRDTLEGKHRLKIEPKSKPVVLSSQELKKFYPNITITQDMPNALTVMPEAHVTSDFEITNAFVFCASLVSDRNLNKKWKYNSYFQIKDPYSFAQIIFNKINERYSSGYYLLEKVRYGLKEIDISSKNKSSTLDRYPKTLIDYYFTKPIEFKDEKEFRMIFVPEYKLEIEPVEITCPELLRYCRFYHNI